MSENTELSPQQYKAIEAITAGYTYANAALQADVTERTIYNWLNDETFSRVLQQTTDSKFQNAQYQLVNALTVSIQTLKDIAVDSAQPAQTRVSAARTLLDSSLRIREHIDYQSRLQALERAVSNA